MIVHSDKKPRAILSRLSIKWKFSFATLAVVLTALLSCAGGLAIMQHADFKRDIRVNLRMLADVVADNSTASLAFDDPNSAKVTLSALRANTHIVSAAIYKHDSGLFATYVRAGEKYEFTADMPRASGFQFTAGRFILTQTIALDGQDLGMVEIVSDTRELTEKLSRFIAISLAIMCIVLAGLYFVSNATQKIVTGPIINVANAARRISKSKNYAARLNKSTEDEVGVLVDGINELLETTETSLALMRRSQEQFEIAVRGAGVGLWDHNLTTGELYYSPRFHQLLGFEDGGLTNAETFWIEHVHPEDKARFEAAHVGHWHSRKPLTIDVRIRTKQNEYRWYQITADSIWDSRGARARIAGSLADVTDRKQTRDQLNRFFEMSRDLICTADFEGRFRSVNPAFTLTLGYTEDEFLGTLIRDLLHPEDIQRIDEEGQLPPTGGGSRQFEARFRHKDGRWVWLSWNFLSLPEEKIVFATARDETERKRAEKKLRRYADQLARSNRELQEFATIASHDLQEPLRKVQAFGDRLFTRCRERLDDQGKDYLNRMLAAVARMKTLINDLLSFSRVDTRGRPFKPIALEDVAREVLSDLEVLIASAEAEVSIRDLPTIDADATQMRQLLQNLIGNAIKFRRKGERPRVSIQGSVVQSATSGRVCHLEVEDNGIGFEEKYTDRIFTIFQRLHGRGEYEGTGVGLAVCRKIVERHRGKITAASVPGRGSRFTVTLPIVQENSEEFEWLQLHDPSAS